MAKVLSDYDFNGQGRKEKYPWADWLDGRIWCIEKGTDFTTDTARFRRNIQAVAHKKNKNLRSNVVGDKIIFQVIAKGK